tara:strand:- start:1728 stop:2510 length:783 start_codon:yes stop_codon:yes gene_type:complete
VNISKPFATVLIPARIESSRLPGKLLKNIQGIPLIVHVAKRSMNAKHAKRVIVCTDSYEIIYECEKYQIEVCNTKSDHLNGTERIAEASRILGLGPKEIIIDVQGDEAFVMPEYIDKVASFMKNTKFGCVVPHQYIKETNNLNRVKIVSSAERVIYFSRKDVPCFFGSHEGFMKKHLSIIGFNAEALSKYSLSQMTELERIEKIELFRLIEIGVEIGTFLMEGQSLSVDTKEDYEKACRMMEYDELFKNLSKERKFEKEV